MSKTLIIYHNDSFSRYYDLYQLCTYDINSYGHLSVYARDRVTGDDPLVAYFRNWDYFIIE